MQEEAEIEERKTAELDSKSKKGQFSPGWCGSAE